NLVGTGKTGPATGTYDLTALVHTDHFAHWRTLNGKGAPPRRTTSRSGCDRDGRFAGCNDGRTGPAPAGEGCAAMYEGDGRCYTHGFEAAENRCRHCGHEYCSECLVYAFGSNKPPYCISCALAASGVRSNAAQRPAL